MITNNLKLKLMKKFTYLVMGLLLITMGSFAQNSVENPGFETWNAGNPDPWAADGGAITLSQNTTNFHEGASSCQVVFTSQDNQYLNSNTFTVTPGDPFVASMYAFDNDTSGRARLCVIFEGADNYYGEYSEDLEEWQLISYEGVVPDGATEAKVQLRFYDVSASWDGDCQVLVDETGFVVDNTVKPEPSNYPTDFAAAAGGVSTNLSWADATGDQLPQNYLVFASTTDSFTAPVDGTPVADDNDISDGLAAINVSYGTEAANFSGLAAGATYYFTIYPYTNTGADMDYKTDGTAPTANVTMPDVTVINSEDFEDDTFGEWSEYSVVGDQLWEIAAYGNPGNCAKMSGYDGAAFDNEDWLISPAFNLDNYTGEVFNFETSMNYTGPALELFISSDYESGDPTTATWEAIDFVPSPGSWTWTASGDIDLSSYTGSVHLAYKFTSTTSGSATWEIDNILLTGTMSNNINENENIEFSVYPNPGSGIYQIRNAQKQDFQISVYNILGEQVMNTIDANSDYTLDIQNLENGVYFLQVISHNQKRAISLVKR